MKRLLSLTLLLAAVVCSSTAALAKEYTLQSPSKRLSVVVDVAEQIHYRVLVDEAEVVAPSRIALRLADGTILGDNAKVRKAAKGSVAQTIAAPFHRNPQVDDTYNHITLLMRGEWSLEFRAYDEGVAYRFCTNLKGEISVAEEVVEWQMSQDWPLVIPYCRPRGDKYESSFESQYTWEPTSKAKEHNELAFLPVLIDVEKKGKLLLMEADVEDYPGLFVSAATEGVGLKGIATPLPTDFRKNNTGAKRPNGYHSDLVAITSGTRTFPWRIVAWAEQDRDLPTNDMVYRLGAPSRLEDTSWIKPGRSAWEWWSGNRLTGVDFRVGINTETYKYHIDFAAKYGLEYILVDAGWYKGFDLLATIDGFDIEAICRHAEEKGVGVILWAVGNLLVEQAEEACAHYAALGVKGFKVDYFDAHDQTTVRDVYRIAEVCAKYKMVVDYHGMYKPTGMSRTWPNVINYEGVYGLEQLKWTDGSKVDMPRNDVTIPFIRMAAGPMDYTQGAMINASKADFRPIRHRPMSQGTRAHQVATYVVFDAPFVMFTDTPSNYLAEDETTRFMATIPATFDHTEVVCGKVGDYIVTARRSGEKWFLGGLTSWEGRTIDIPLDFLGEGEWKAELFLDGVNADLTGTDYRTEKRTIKGGDTLSVEMKSGGGFAAIVSR